MFGHNGTRVVHRHQPAVAAGGRQTVGRRRPAQTTRPTGTAHQRRPAVRHHIGCLARLSESLRHTPRPRRTPGSAGTRRHGGVPAPAGLPRIGRDRSASDARIRACREVRAVLTRIRAMGLTRPGGLAAGLGEDFVIGQADMPAEPEPARTEPGPAAGDHAAALRAPTWIDLTSPRDAHRRRAGHRHRSPPRRDLRAGLRLPDPTTTTACPC